MNYCFLRIDGVPGAGGYVVVALLCVASVFNIYSLLAQVSSRGCLFRHSLWLGVALPLASGSAGALLASRAMIAMIHESAIDGPYPELFSFSIFAPLSGLVIAALGCAAHILSLRAGRQLK
jgi:hypothetical protein